MRVSHRTNLLWGLVVLAVGLIVLLQALDFIPAGVSDVLSRSWPLLLVLAGLSILLRDRVRFGSLIALVISAALLAGVVTSAFSNRATQIRSDYQTALNESVAPGINLLRVRVAALSTDVEIVRSLTARTITGQFIGSSESLLQTTYNEPGDGAADLTISETQPNQFPFLEAIGRGTFRLELPASVPLDIEFTGDQGTLILNMDGLSLERLNMDLKQGDAVVSLPEYQPLGSTGDAILGTLVVRDGNITVRVPTAVAARFALNRGGSSSQPVYDPQLYNYLVGDILEARNFDSAAIKVRYALTAPRGLLTVESTPA
ncbi:MAG: DUF5668 domain-containing protein [Anaerolineae bacterium]